MHAHVPPSVMMMHHFAANLDDIITAKGRAYAYAQVIGEGFHPQAGKPHAEVYALRAAGQAAQGATAYVTLEPCNHFGRTPPCSRALVAAGVSRVPIASQPRLLVAAVLCYSAGAVINLLNVLHAGGDWCG